MKTHCLHIDELSRIVGMHQTSSTGVEIAKKLGHIKTTIYSVSNILSFVRLCKVKNLLDVHENGHNIVLEL